LLDRQNQIQRRLLLLIAGVFASSDHGVQLRQHDGALSNRPELTPDQLVDKVTHGVVMLLLSLGLLDGQLQLTLHPPQKEVVDHYIASGVVQLIFDAHQFEETPHFFTVVKVVHSVEKTNEAAFTALQFRPQQIAHPKSYQVDVAHPLFPFVCPYFVPCPEKVMDEGVGVCEHEGS
jgi:hypothetical protein